MWKIILWAIIGWVAGYLINQLANLFGEIVKLQEQLEESDEESMEVPFFIQPPALLMALVGKSEGKRPLILELLSIFLFGSLPLLIDQNINLIINTIHIAILLLIMVIDLENKAVFGIIIYPATLLALVGSFFVTPDENSIGLAIVGAIVGFLLFWVLYKVAQLRYGKEAGALGFGDVQIAMLMGAMLGFHRILFALGLAMILGGVITLLILLFNRNVGRRTALPYGQYLTLAAIVMLIWGAAYVEYYWS